MRGLKASLAGEISDCGLTLAQSLTEMGLVDECRLYIRPVVVCGGKPTSPIRDLRCG